VNGSQEMAKTRVWTTKAIRQDTHFKSLPLKGILF
jgi:hypothetical protein